MATLLINVGSNPLWASVPQWTVRQQWRFADEVVPLPLAWQGPGSWRPALGRGRWLAGHVLGTLLLVAVVVVAVWLVASQPSRSPDGGPPGAPASPVQQPGAPASPAVRDGALSFTVTGQRCQVPTLGSGPVRTHAGGQFCIFEVTVHNHGAYPGWVFPFGQRLIDDNGGQYTASSWSWVYYKPARDLLKPLASNGTVSGSLVFDIPAGARPSLLIVHDTPWSRGTPLRLGAS